MNLIRLALLLLLSALVSCQNLQTDSSFSDINLAELETPEFLAQVDAAMQKVNENQTIVSVLMSL